VRLVQQVYMELPKVALAAGVLGGEVKL